MRNNPLAYIDETGREVKSIRLKAEGAQEGRKMKSPEAGDVSTLGPKEHGSYWTHAVNIIVAFTQGDSADNYDPGQKAFVIAPQGKNADPHRPGESGKLNPDNPEDSNVTRSGDKLVWQDNPGLQVSGVPRASVSGTYLAVFISTVKPKDEKKGMGKPTDKVMYWAVRIDIKDGKIERSAAAEITKEQYEKVTGTDAPNRVK